MTESSNTPLPRRVYVWPDANNNLYADELGEGIYTVGAWYMQEDNNVTPTDEQTQIDFEHWSQLGCEPLNIEKDEQGKYYLDDFARHAWFGWQACIANIRNSSRPHSDDLAIDRFAAAMKQKMAMKRSEGRSGWEKCHLYGLMEMLIEHVHKGDMRDVGNIAMMIWNNSQLESIRP